MNIFLTLAFLFSLGSFLGWILELFFRKFFSFSNPEHKWINPGFLRGPYLPLYGFSLCIFYFLAQINLSFIESKTLQHITLFFVMAISVTIFEYFAGIIFIKGMKVKLWDYSHLKGNIQGIICPQFTFFWFILGGFYYIFINPFIDEALIWLSKHLIFSFVIGFFYGIFTVDLFYSLHILSKIKKFAQDKQIIVKYENLKSIIQKENAEILGKINFFFFFKATPHAITKSLEKYIEKERELFKNMIK